VAEWLVLFRNSSIHLVHDLNDGLVDPLIGGVKDAAKGDQAMRERRTAKKLMQCRVDAHAAS
jgi:hypothetical protein